MILVTFIRFVEEEGLMHNPESSLTLRQRSRIIA
jgi:hypothetical protein